MNVLAALAVGLCCALVVASLSGTMPKRSHAKRPGRLAARRDRANIWLQQAGVGLGAGAFWMGSAFAGGFAFLAIGALTGSVFVALVPAIAVGLLPRGYFGRKRRTRMKAVQTAWPDGLRDIVASIAAGLSLTQAITNLAASGPEPMRVAFAQFPQLARVLGTGPALELLKEDLADATSDRVLEVLILAQERGGSIVREILEDLIAATTCDLRLLDELETEGLEMRINARSVMVLPWLVLIALTARPGAFRDFYQSPGGVVTLLLAGGLTIVGVLVLGRLGREPIEARPFAASRA
jgi:tight adherence protein B